MSPAKPQSTQLATADLDNPLYYLENMETVLGWVQSHHGDLLTAEELDRLASFHTLSMPARALLTRMVMRTGDLFRSDKLKYPELGVPEARALDEIMEAGWLDTDPLLSLDELFRLFTLGELRPAMGPLLKAAGEPANLPKGRMRDALLERFPDPLTVADWLGQHARPVIRLKTMALFDRVRLMFFGNLRQSWSDFVLVELGHQQYEPVTFTPDSRAFQQRSEVDLYLAMHQCREWLDQGVPAHEVWQAVPSPSNNAWLTSRRDRLLLELGRQAERQGERELALEAFASSGHREARLKQLRLLERMKRHQEAWAIASEWQNQELSDAETQGLARILKRLASRLGEIPPPPPEQPLIREITLTLPKPEVGSVEYAVRDHLYRDEAPVLYVENTLINGLFGLLCWQTIFAPVPGAFFHPFHVGPADLTREDFVSRRQASFEQCFAWLADGSYRKRILANYRAKQGTTNPFVIWPVITEELLSLALDCLPPADLERLFRRLLLNIREHRSGFPDLILFLPNAAEPNKRYEMIEVKGPGDRLQDHQIRWLEFFAVEGIPASVCYVRWQDSEAME
ncbi:VRR-NUC domain-containing protein [Marinobacter sp. es.048]|uniref:VRR-NUC domain-containing protein n=1 Tax=Marinobacter sp. es.048 TaxID=1761795 RepID=UPI000B58ACD5|nr:VRR-NUC domain-containing protein [Marinobacter sp. es.048]SNC61651.1 VRR-NUC domain-containing protein [Marinobacter sp. es.048]